ncbi:MAG: class I SAM-dependent methyltransferase [Vicinamibacterales bacterium]
MSDRDRREEEVETARRYFSGFADDYHRAFSGGGSGPLQGTINRLFRKKTFARRTEIIGRLLERYGVAGRTVLDLGCGSGEVSLLAARLGAASVVGLDIVDRMVVLAREAAASASLDAKVEFRVADIMNAPLGTADVTLLVGVVEYYADLEALLGRAAGATRELMIIADTRGPFWRRTLRKALARLKRFNLYYRSPKKLSAILAAAGFDELERIAGHSFTILAYRREAATTASEQKGARALEGITVR